jgi:hypothetical protein
MSGLEQLEFDSRQIQKSVSSPHLPNGFCDPPCLVFSGFWLSKVTAEVNLVLNLRMHEDTARRRRRHHRHHIIIIIIIIIMPPFSSHRIVKFTRAC